MVRVLLAVLAMCLVAPVAAARKDKIDCESWRVTERQHANFIIQGFDSPPDCTPNTPECVIMLAKHRKYVAGFGVTDEKKQQLWDIDAECGTVLFVLQVEVEKMADTALSLVPDMQMPLRGTNKDALVRERQ